MRLVLSRYPLLVAVLLASLAGSARAEPPRVLASDGAGTAVPLTEARISLVRTPPQAAGDADPDGLRLWIAGGATQAESDLSLYSYDADHLKIDTLAALRLAVEPCPPQLDAALCLATPPIRAVADATDRDHPLGRGRSILAELGGTLVVSQRDRELGRLPVQAPRNTVLGATLRVRAKLRLLMVRLAPGGALPVGGDREGALQIARASLGRANALWQSCGISFGAPHEAVIEIVDPPPSHLLAVGCAHGVPASGGRVQLSIRGRAVGIAVDRGMLPQQVARRLSRAIERAGFVAQISELPRMAAGAHPTSDVTVRSAKGELVDIAPSGSLPVSSDATLGVCIGSVELEDGLQHFGDVDAASGTIEERTLIKAYDDRDPTTIEVFVVPGFARGARIGESFILSDGGAIANTVLLDRAGVRSNRASFTLAHELGHVLLDDPGHPDDFAVDTPTLLMDGDAADPSAFGPRRLSPADCTRALRQSGPGAPLPLLSPWPIGR